MATSSTSGGGMISSSRQSISPNYYYSPFTANQWHELQTQAHIYKYIISGLPVPPDLISTLRTSLMQSPVPSVPPQPAVGWGCFQVGFNTSKLEPEPGRCRRTDGKKWRCSREACLDSKYCEKHMHRGKNRSRKPVKAASLKQPPPPATAMEATDILPSSHTNYGYSNYQLLHPFFVAADDSSSSSSYQSSQPGSTLSVSTPPQDVITHTQFIDPGDEKTNFRYYHGPMSAERAFVPESSRTDDGISSQCSYEGGDHPVSRGQAPVKIESSHQQEYQNEQEQWFVLGSDFRPRSSGQITTGKEDETERPMHHFFGK